VGNPVQSIKVYGVQDRRRFELAKLPWIVRWSMDGRQHSRSWRTRAEADRYRSQLLMAQTAGLVFDPVTAEPVSWQPGSDEVQVHMWARRWLAEQWPEWQPRTRASAIEALARFVPLAVVSRSTAPPQNIRAHLVCTLVPGVDPGEVACERWLDRHSLELRYLDRQVLAAAEQRLVKRADGSPLAASTASRYRKVAHACIRRAVELDILPTDPWPPPPRGRSRRKSAKVDRTVDVKKLPDPPTMAAAIAAISTHQPGSRTYQIMTAVIYYAGLRPSEVVMLRPRAVHCPKSGWGSIDVVEADVSFDEPGEPKTGSRVVPIPPILVRALRAWLDSHDFASTDLMFRTRTGGRPRAPNWARAWHRALGQVGAPRLRVYDCRHAAATTWLGAGVPLGEVAKRLGHSVETLVSTYVGALIGDEALANKRIERALSGAN
jgi:integrase